MNYYWLFLGLLSAQAAGAAIEPQLGRLFFSAAERANMNAARRQPQVQPLLAQGVRFDGVVLKQGKVAQIWIHGQVLRPNETAFKQFVARPDGTVAAGGSRLRVGQESSPAQN